MIGASLLLSLPLLVTESENILSCLLLWDRIEELLSLISIKGHFLLGRSERDIVPVFPIKILN